MQASMPAFSVQSAEEGKEYLISSYHFASKMSYLQLKSSTLMPNLTFVTWIFL
jgi:hypothetical protein